MRCLQVSGSIIILQCSRRFYSFRHSPASKAAPYIANVVRDEHLILFACKRIFKLQFQLLCYLIFFQLILDIFRGFLCVLPNCVHIISPTPELPASVLELHIRKSLVYYLAAFSFKKPANPDTLIFGGISTSMCTCPIHTSASMIFTPFQLHKSLNIPPIAILPFLFDVVFADHTRSLTGGLPFFMITPLKLLMTPGLDGGLWQISEKERKYSLRTVSSGFCMFCVVRRFSLYLQIQ